MAANPYSQYQWRDDPARRVTTAIAGGQAPSAGAQNVAQGAQPTQNDAVTGPAVSSPWATSAPKSSASSPFVVPGAKPAQGSFSTMLANAQPPREQNMAAANATISQLLTPQAGPSAEGQRALSDLDKQQAEQARQIKEQSALSGRMTTGQSIGDSLRLSERMMTQRADAAGQVAAADAERATQRQQQGLSGFLSMESLGQQAQASEASQRLAEAQMAQNAYQFQSQQDFQKWATEEGWNQDEINRGWQSIEAQKGRDFQAGESAAERTSRETLAYAQLSQQDRALAQESSQFNDRLSFDRWATQAGLDDKTADRIWQANEAAKGRTFEEKILGQQQKFQAGESALDRELSQTQFGARLGLDQQQLGETIRQFNSKLDFDKWATQAGLNQQEADRLWKSSESDKQRAYEGGERQLDRALESSQFAQTLGLQKEQLTENVRQFNSRQEFDTWAKNMDITQAESDKIWQAQQSDIQRKWQSGERLSGQEHEVLVESLREKADLAKLERNQVLNLQTLEQQNKYETGIETLRQGYENSRLTQGFSHEEAMQQMQAQLQADLSAQGFSQEQALQASQIEAQKIEADRDREFQDRMQTARLLQENSQFLQTFGLDKQQVDLQAKQIMSQLSESATRLEMDQKTFDAAMENQEFAKNLETAAILTEKFGDSPEMLEKSTDLIWEGLYKGGLVTKEEYDTGKLMAKASTFSNSTAFKQYAQAQGSDPGLVAEVVKEMTDAGGQWMTGTTGSSSGTSTATPGSNDAIQAAKDAFNDALGAMPGNTNVDEVQKTIDYFGAVKDNGGTIGGTKYNTQYQADAAIIRRLNVLGLSNEQLKKISLAAIGQKRFDQVVQAQSDMKKLFGAG